MIDPFIGGQLKIDRARKHIDEIAVDVAKYVALPPYHWETVPAGTTDWTKVIIRLDRPIPDELSVVVGDAVHNMRSALDNMVSALARHNGVTSNSKLNKVYFPTGQTKHEFEQACDGLRPFVGAFATQALKTLEVFDGGSGDLLKILGTLSNRDKHRLLIPTIPAMKGGLLFGLTNKIIAEGKPAKVEVKVGPIAAGKAPVEDGDELLSYPDTNHPGAPIQFKPELTVSLDFLRLPVGEDVSTTLTRMRTAALDALATVRSTIP